MTDQLTDLLLKIDQLKAQLDEKRPIIDPSI